MIGRLIIILVRLGEDSAAVTNFGVYDFSRLAVTDWR